MQMEQRVGRAEYEAERSTRVEVAHVPLHPLHLYAALVRLAPSLGKHVRRKFQAHAPMPVGCDRDQFVSGAAPKFQHTPALPVGLGPVEVDGRLATREQPVIQPRIRVEPFTHEAHTP